MGKEISFEKYNEAEKQLKIFQQQIDYDTKDFIIEHIVQKFDSKEFFIPTYQRDFIWPPSNRSNFIESVLLGLPIPFMFFCTSEDGKSEIIDGSQRTRTLAEFVSGKLILSGLKKLTALNGFSFNDLSESQQRKFKNKTLRIVILEETTSEEIRRDLFHRINTSFKKANPSEIRRGSYDGPFTKFIEKLSKDKLFTELCPLSATKQKRQDGFELVLRFFAYSEDYLNAKQRPQIFLDNYLKNHLYDFDKIKLEKEFKDMLKFVKKTFPNGFAKPDKPNSTPRVRFEALSVGSNLALREKPNLNATDISWVESDEFKQHTTSDASNNPGRLKSRIEFVRDKLLGR